MNAGPNITSVLDPAYGSSTGTGGDDTSAFFLAIAWLNGGANRTLLIPPVPSGYNFNADTSGPLAIPDDTVQNKSIVGGPVEINLTATTSPDFLSFAGNYATLENLILTGTQVDVTNAVIALTATTNALEATLDNLRVTCNAIACLINAPNITDNLRIQNSHFTALGSGSKCLELRGFGYQAFLDDLILETDNGICLALTDNSTGGGYLWIRGLECKVASTAPGAVAVQFAAGWYMLVLSDFLLNNESDGSATAFQFLQGSDEVSVVNVNATGFAVGIDMSDPGLTFLTNVLFSNCQFVNCAQYALHCAIASAVFSASLNHCILRTKSPASASVLVDSTAASGGLNSASNKLTMFDTLIEVTGDNAICVSVTAQNTTQLTMLDCRLFTDAGTGRVGYAVNGSGANTNMQPISIRGGSVSAQTGIQILATVAYVAPVTIEDVDCSQCTTPITFASAVETYGPTLVIRNCKGINPYGALTGQPAFPATTVAIVNPYPFDCDVFVTANAATVGLSVATSGSAGVGSSVPILAGSTVPVFVSAGGQSITPTFTGTTPTWTWIAR